MTVVAPAPRRLAAVAVHQLEQRHPAPGIESVLLEREKLGSDDSVSNGIAWISFGFAKKAVVLITPSK